MKPRTFSRPQLAVKTNVMANALAVGKAPSLPAATAAQFAAQLEAESAKLSEDNQKLVNSRAMTNYLLAEARVSAALNVATVENLKAAMRAVNAPDSEYEALGLDPPAKPSPIRAQIPSALSATGSSNGVNTLKWRGNNVPGSVIYHIEAYADGKWQLVGTTTRQKFKHEDVTPGEALLYRVYATSAKFGASEVSNQSSVYK